MQPPFDPEAQAPTTPDERLPTEQSRLVLAWITFGSLVVGVLGVGALISTFFP